jgi:AraC-like DNA-binding protein
LNLLETSTQSGVLPLGCHARFASNDLDEARAAVAEVYCDHRLEAIGRQPFDARHNRVNGHALSINVMTYGAKTLIVPGALEDFYLFQFPLRGHASINNGANQHEIGGGFSGVLNPDAHTCMIWSENCVQVMIQVEKQAMMAVARAELGLPSNAPVQFMGANNLKTENGRAFLGILNYLMQDCERGEVPLGGESLLARQLERTLLVGLLQTQNHSLSDGICQTSGPIPRVLRVAESFMRENLRVPIMIEDIAQAVGTSERALQAAFRARYKRPPMTVLRDLRLEMALQELSNPTSETRVTDVATDLGFYHLGRFSEIYRKKFGCSPSETLRYARQ